jgi:hypothetical protein
LDGVTNTFYNQMQQFININNITVDWIPGYTTVSLKLNRLQKIIFNITQIPNIIKNSPKYLSKLQTIVHKLFSQNSIKLRIKLK